MQSPFSFLDGLMERVVSGAQPPARGGLDLDGELTVDADVVLVAAGAVGNLEVAESAGLDIDGGGVKINGKAVAPKSYNIDPSALKLGDTLSVGKRKGFKLV